MATISAREVLAQRLERDPAFRAEWERLALARQVAELVLRYRVEHGLTQTELAHRLEVTQSAVARLESGEVNPALETLQRLARQLGIALAVQIRPAAAGRPASEPPTPLVVSAEAIRRPPVPESRPRASAEQPRRGGGGAGWSGLPAAATASRGVMAQQRGMHGKTVDATTVGRSTRGESGGKASARPSQKASISPRSQQKSSSNRRSPKR